MPTSAGDGSISCGGGGKQDIEVYGLDPRTRAAQVIVEADYRMKLVGMGLEAGVPAWSAI